jgi:hypothetical protein
LDTSAYLPAPDSPFLPHGFVINLLDRVAKKPLMGQPFVRFADALWARLGAFELGAVMGVEMAGNLEVFLESFSSPEDRGQFTDRVKADSIAAYESFLVFSDRRPPTTLADLYLTQNFLTRDLQFGDIRDSANQKLDLAAAYSECVSAMVDGVGMGAMFPEVTAEAWPATWEAASIEQLRSLGLPFDPPPLVSFAARRLMVRRAMHAHIAAQRPHLLEPLNLSA